MQITRTYFTTLVSTLVKFGQSVSTSVGAQRGDQRIFGVSGEI